MGMRRIVVEGSRSILTTCESFPFTSVREAAAALESNPRPWAHRHMTLATEPSRWVYLECEGDLAIAFLQMTACKTPWRFES